jgi:hypothetical protein
VRVRWALAILLALLFMAESGTTYGDKWVAPFAWVQSSLFEATPWEVRWFDHITALCLLLALRQRDGRGPRVRPMRNALLVAAGALVAWILIGALRGGTVHDASWQTYLPLSGVLLAFTIAAAFRTAEHFAFLAKVLFVAAVYRAVMCWSFYFLYVKTLQVLPEYITSHDDTVLWVMCMLVLILRIITVRRMASRVWASLLFLFLVGAVTFNQRRIAWVSLGMGLVLMFVLLPAGPIKRRVTRFALAVVPLVMLYAVVGWDRPEKIFRPLKSFATVSTEEDASTKARNMENLGLIATSNSSSLFLGTGWGHRFIEVSTKYSISSGPFKMWAFFPHNSLLGLLAFTGVLGFFAFWLPFPTAMFLHARTARRADDPLTRNVSIVCATQLVVCANQFYGDMGITFPKSVYLLSIGYAAALRLPILAGAWPVAQRGGPIRAPAPPDPHPAPEHHAAPEHNPTPDNV